MGGIYCFTGEAGQEECFGKIGVENCEEAGGLAVTSIRKPCFFETRQSGGDITQTAVGAAQVLLAQRRYQAFTYAIGELSSSPEVGYGCVMCASAQVAHSSQQQQSSFADVIGATTYQRQRPICFEDGFGPVTEIEQDKSSLLN